MIAESFVKRSGLSLQWTNHGILKFNFLCFLNQDECVCSNNVEQMFNENLITPCSVW